MMKKILVTGAGGFLGGWIVESFLLAGVPVRAGIRSWNGAVRLARRSAEMAICDVLSPRQLLDAMQGCAAVVHCAVGDDRVTVEGTRNVLSAAHRLGLKRVVHISSVAVYGKANGLLRESQARRSQGDPYARRKIAAERVCEEFAARGLPVVILRPSLVYGPFSQIWTVSFARRLHSGKWGTFGGRGEGTCNLVYVTDVVQAVERALRSENAPGETFHVNGADLITWNEYFERFNHALGGEPLPRLATWPMALKARLLSPVRRVGRYVLTRHASAVGRIHGGSPVAARSMRFTEQALQLTPASEQMKLYGVEVEYAIDKARKMLGYAPRVQVSQGLSFCASWLRRQGLVVGQGKGTPGKGS